MSRFEFESKFGSTGTGEGQFNEPFGCTISNSRLFISDSGNNRIQVFDLLNNFLYEFGSAGTGEGEFDTPKGMYAYNSEIYVLDSGNQRVQVFDLDGVFAREFEGVIGDEFNDAEFIFGKGNEIYVADRLNSQIQVFDIAGTFLRKFGTYGTENGQFQATSGIAVNGDNLYIGDESAPPVWILENGIWIGEKAVWNADGLWKTFYISFLKAFTTAPVLSGYDYVYEDQTGSSNDVIVHGSNHIKYTAANEQWTSIRDTLIADGDTLEFTARNDDSSIYNYIFSSDQGSRPQVRFNNNNFQLSVNVGTSAAFTTGVDTTTWNRYKLHFDVASARMGLSVNDGVYDYIAIADYSYINIPINKLTRLAVPFASLSIYNIIWKDINGDSKLNMPCTEGGGLLHNTIEANLVSEINTATFENDITLLPLNVVRGCTLENLNGDVIQQAGQSNMTIDFASHNDTPFSGIYVLPQNHLYVHDINKTVPSTVRALNSLTNGFYGSIEVSAAMKFTAANKRLTFVKTCFSGASLQVDWQKGGDLYNACLANTAVIKARFATEGKVYKCRQWWWLQGETVDADYYNDFIQMWTDLIADGVIDNETVPVIGYLSGDVYAHQAATNADFDAIIVTLGGTTIPTSDAGKASDNIHYNTSGAILLGDRFGDYYLAQNYTIVTTDNKQIVPILDDGLTDANGNAISNPSDEGFSDADSVVDYPDNAQVNDYLSLRGITRTNQTFADIIAYITDLGLIRYRNANQITSLEFRE